MSTLHLVPADIIDDFKVYEWRNAAGILQTAHPSEWADLLAVLQDCHFKRSEIVAGGKNKSTIAKRIDGFLLKRGWLEKSFVTKILVDDEARDSPTHKVDCFKGKVGLEIEWNNKDPFFDRDLNNFRLLFELRVIEVGIIITRASELQNLFNSLGKKIAEKYGNSTTHMNKLLPRLEGGGGGGCPILAFGITDHRYVEDALSANHDLMEDDNDSE